MKQVRSVGITGGIGSGKSLICNTFRSLGYRVYDADSRAKALMAEDAELVSGIKALLGEAAYRPDGSLDRAYVGGIVFQNPDKLAQLNQLVHPATGRDFARWMAETPEDYRKPFVLKEAAILYESGAWKQSDGVISVYAPKSLRLRRVMARDQAPEEAVIARMDKQWPELEKLRRADFAIFNDGEHLIAPQVAAAIRFFMEKWAGAPA